MASFTRPSIIAVLARYGADVRERSGWQPLRCPFHDDQTASASVNVDIGGFKCLACGVSGDVYKLLMEQEGISFREAAELGDRLEADPNATSSAPRTARTKRAYRPPGRRGRR